MIDITKVEDGDFLGEIQRRFREKNASIEEMQRMTQNLLDLNDKARQAEAVKSEFLSLIKNEFNNPISSLLSFSQALASGRHTEKIADIARMTHQELQRIDFHMKNIFAAAEIESGQIQNTFEDVYLDELVNEVRSSLRYIIADKHLDIQLFNELSGAVQSDSAKLFTILLNLLSNACEYSHVHGRIVVWAGVDDGSIVIFVKDFGEGIPTQYHGKIFNRFTQFHSGKNRPHTGLGLGLSVVKGLVESLDGSIESYSSSEQTVFTVRLPAQPVRFDDFAGGDSFDGEFDDEDMVEM
ncbi:HAMP domain-containing histidine kinase [Desulfurispirillum indicum]|uniref:sensor histidine kinase n=1 Tax=Desulfurispirillum indicum TaxID=936456 RepID=UPI001CFA4C62|nr:HAMP domain-containing sensor histidine kinase [Desulfurispirillum indicum]UCZ57920.1 HAMP domain-containing histidine kinase [Desulfurispirillum indicum]